MGKKTTQIGGFFLYVSTMRYRKGATFLTFREYCPTADEEYRKLSEVEKELWKERARELREDEVGKTFRLVDKLLKKEGNATMQEAREKCVKQLVMKCWDLAL
jgi:hypothetical protein